MMTDARLARIRETASGSGKPRQHGSHRLMLLKHVHLIERQPRERQAQHHILPVLQMIEYLPRGEVHDGEFGPVHGQPPDMLGSRVRPAGTALAARRSEARGFSAVRTDLPGSSLGVSPARGGVTDRLFPGVDHCAGTAQRLAFERGCGASNASAGGSPGAVNGLLGGPSQLEAWLAAGSAAHGRAAPAADAKACIGAGLPALAGTDPGLTAFCMRRSSSIFQAGRAGFCVALALGPAGLFAAAGAQPTVRLAGESTAFSAQPAGQPIPGPLAGAAVFGLARLGIPEACNAGVTAPGGP